MVVVAFIEPPQREVMPTANIFCGQKRAEFHRLAAQLLVEESAVNRSFPRMVRELPEPI